MEESTYKAGYFAVAVAGVALTAWGMFRKKDEPEAKRLLNHGDSFLLLGDSIGVGIQKPLAKLSGDYGSYMDSMVEVGATFSRWAKEIEPADAGFDLVLISLGSNDAAGNPLAQAAAMDHVIGTLQSRGAPVYWIVPPSFRLGHFTAKQQQFASMLEERGVFPLPFDGHQPSVASDPMHIHLTPDGYRTYAAQIFSSITSKSWLSRSDHENHRGSLCACLFPCDPPVEQGWVRRRNPRVRHPKPRRKSPSLLWTHDEGNRHGAGSCQRCTR